MDKKNLAKAIASFTVAGISLAYLANAPMNEAYAQEIKSKKTSFLSNYKIKFPAKSYLHTRIDKLPDEDISYAHRDFADFSIAFENRVDGTPLEGYSRLIWEVGVEKGINPYFGAAIILHETGNGKSFNLRDKNNVGGMKRKNYMSFESIDASVEFMFESLRKNYLDKGLDNPAKINTVYSEDPKWGWQIAVMMNILY